MVTDPDELAALRRTMSGFLRLLRARWGLLAAAMTVCGGIAIAYALFATPVYKASVVLAPIRESELGSGLNALLGQFGDLAALAGLGVSTTDDDLNAIAILRSRAFAERLISDKALLPYIFPERWDANAGDWRGSGADRTPTMDDAWHRFNRSTRQIFQDLKSGLVTITIRLEDRVMAATLANELAARINVEIRERANSEAKASQRFLEKQLLQTEDVELRQAIYRLMELQIRRQVLANSRPEFAFALIDPATVPDADRFDTPKRTLVIVLGLVIGAMIGLLSILLSQLARPMNR